MRDNLLHALSWIGSPPPLRQTPEWAKTAVLGIGYQVDDLQESAREATHIAAFLAKYDAARIVPPHPQAAARAFNDWFQPYSTTGFWWYVDPSHPAYVAAFDQAVQYLQGEGVEGAYFDALFGDDQRNDNQHGGADRRNHLDPVTLVDRVRNVHGWNALLIGEQSRLGNRYGVGALQPCGFRANPGGSAVPFVDALVHDQRITAGTGNLLEQWFAHVLFGARGLANPTRRDVQNIAHDDVFGFVKGQLVVDGRTEYEVAPGTPNPTIAIQIFEADPALHPVWADPLEVLGFSVLQDVADLLYPRMMWWRATTRALREGRMLPPPYPTAQVGGQPIDEWFVLQKAYFFKPPGFAVPAGTTSTYETERFPVSFWALPDDPEELTLFVGNPTYDAVTLDFAFSTADYPAEMGTGAWDVVLDRDPEDGPDVAPALIADAATRFAFRVGVRPLAFTRLTMRRR